MTVQQLADAADLSRRMLTQIELGQANPSLVTVGRVTRALGTGFASLALGVRAEPLTVSTPGSGVGVVVGGRQPRLAPNSDRAAAPFELWEATLQPGDRYAQPDPAGSEELFLVLSGTLAVEAARLDPVPIQSGGSARLASDREYAHVNAGMRPVRFVRVVRLASGARVLLTKYPRHAESPPTL